MSDLTTKPATELLSLLRDRKLSSVELVTEHLLEIGRLDKQLHSFVDLDVEGSLSAAGQADKNRIAGIDLPLLGLPISIKSSIEVAGLRCETGSLLNRGHVPTLDAVSVTRLKAAGAIVLGTTNCPEFLMAYETDNLLYGATANPWNQAYTAGGSSGGEAAAIAAGLSAGGLGSDSGGSVREPAHFTGICALKPTAGRIPTEGHSLPCVGPFSILGALGPMARTIEDVTLLFEVAAALGTRRPPKTQDLKARPVGILVDDDSVPIAKKNRDAVTLAADLLRSEGFTIQEFRSEALQEAQRLWWTFFMRGGRLLLEPLLAQWEGPLSPTFQYYLDTVRAAPLLDAGEMLSAWGEAEQLRARLELELARYTAVLTPVASIAAFRHGERHWQIDGRTVEYFEAMSFMQWFNLLGAPAAVVPMLLNETGLPVGVQIAGGSGTDEEVLAIARILDRTFGYRVPPISSRGGPA